MLLHARGSKVEELTKVPRGRNAEVTVTEVIPVVEDEETILAEVTDVDVVTVRIDRRRSDALPTKQINAIALSVVMSSKIDNMQGLMTVF